jgi:hypothetical protein
MGIGPRTYSQLIPILDQPKIFCNWLVSVTAGISPSILYFPLSRSPFPFALALCNNEFLRDIWVMVDVVANHVGPVGYSYNTIVPFNQAAHYHGCSSCPSGCQIQDFTNQPQVCTFLSYFIYSSHPWAFHFHGFIIIIYFLLFSPPIYVRGL